MRDAWRTAGIVGAVACGLLAAGPPAAGAASVGGPGDRACTQVDHSSSARLRRAAVALPPASPWSTARGSSLRAALVTASRGRLLLCVATGFRDRRRALATGIRVRRADALRAVAVADPWVAWAVRRPGAPSTTVRWRRIDGGGTVVRRVPGTVRRLVATTDGRVVAQTATSGAGRFVVLRRTAAAQPVPAGRLDARLARTGQIVQWSPTTVALVPARAGRPVDVLPLDLDRGRARATCEAPDRDGVGRATTDAVDVRVLNAAVWAAGSVSAQSGLDVCAPDGRRLRSLLLRSDRVDHHADGEEGAVAAVAVGPAVVLEATWRRGTSGSGTEATRARRVLVRAADGTVRDERATLAVVGPGTAAFVAGGRLWVADAAGLRAVATTLPLTTVNTALYLTGDGLRVRAPEGELRVPLTPAAASGAGEPPRGLRVDDLCPKDYDVYGFACAGAPGSPPPVESQPDPDAPPAAGVVPAAPAGPAAG
ncbi:hypothetical protein [Patulibacter sp. SYSU D01012]|uniref:hypothetical protein n=1 Tax=Patulibacter sp. SYSU D01012 TaxID=2817381 RepID=UPI001B3151ED|nr:hypothetical protein [Patulibacter sp. SYSU D01012]